ncbi:hypothetical protein R1sor_014842 [Riccia sorocarpa]|uniref:Uncharacterized protein n=1 Tax=Riccia sorocarpa TaxID=122646 RepID=A0ABD3HAJ2_9MARC
MDISKEKRKRELEEAAKAKEATKSQGGAEGGIRTRGTPIQSRNQPSGSQGRSRRRVQKVKEWLRNYGQGVGAICLQELRIKEGLATRRLMEIAEGSKFIIDYTEEGKAGQL